MWTSVMFDGPLLFLILTITFVPVCMAFRWPWSDPVNDAEIVEPAVCNKGTKFECACTGCWLTTSATGGADDKNATMTMEWVAVEFEEHRACGGRFFDAAAERRLRQRLAAWTNEECAIVADCRHPSTRHNDLPLEASGEEAQWATSGLIAFFEASNVVLGGWECGGAVQSATRLRFVVVYNANAELDDANLMDVDVLAEVVRAREHLLAAAVGIGVESVHIEAEAHHHRHYHSAVNQSQPLRKLSTWCFYAILALCAFLSTVLVSFVFFGFIALALLGYGIRLRRLLTRGEWSLRGKPRHCFEDEKGQCQSEQQIPLRPRTSQQPTTTINMEML